jgi:hypothetical protein
MPAFAGMPLTFLSLNDSRDSVLSRVSTPTRMFEGSAFVTAAGVELAESLRIQENRHVGDANLRAPRDTQRQIPESPFRREAT